MRIALAYCTVVFVWATTPLGIKWSNSSLSFHAAITFRFVLALALCALVLLIMRKKLIQKKSDWHAFLAGALGVFPNMFLVYWASQHISSGLISIIFGMYPFFVGLFSVFILKENVLTTTRILALLVALIGLALIQYDQLHLGGFQALGMVMMILSTCLFGLSSVWLKHAGGAVEPMRQSVGTLMIATPLFLVTWWVFDGVIPATIDVKSLGSVAYLAVFGSCIGGTLFFYVLSHCKMTSVSLITLITPMMALVIGALLNAEQATTMQWLGCGLILCSLAMYQNLGVRLRWFTKAPV